MRYHGISAFAIGLVLLVAGAMSTAMAADPVVRVSPKPGWLTTFKPYDKRPSSRSIENGYYLALVERQIDVERQADYRHTVREIVSEAGIQNGSQITVGFDPAYERLDFHQIVVWRDGKPQNRLNPADFKVIADEEDFSRFIYQGSYSANYIIPDIRKGDRIEYSYTITGRNPVFDNKFCENIYLQGSQLIAHQVVVLQCSAARKLYTKDFNDVPKPDISGTANSKRYIWEDFQVPAADSETSDAGWFDPYARVEVTEYNSWADVIDWALKVNPVSTHLTGELAQRVTKLKKDAGNDKEKYFRAAVKTVQDEVRYMGIEIGEYSHRANHPENVFDQRYGDCKDKALLLASMLRANDIPADMVLVNTSVEDKIDQLLPTTNAFNHAVVVATLNGKQVWIDATIAYQRGKGTDLYFPEYGKGLQLKPGSNGLVTIPKSKTGKIIANEKYTITSATNKVRLDVKTVYTLNQADDIRSRIASTGMYTTEKNYLKYYDKIYPKIETRDSLIVKDDEDKNELTTVESYLIPDFFTPDSTSAGRYTAGFYANCIDEQLPAINAQVKNPLSVNYPYNVDYTIEVNMPSPWDIDPRQFSIKRDAYTFASDYSSRDNALVLHYQFAFLKDYIPVDQLDQARKDISKLKDSKLSYNFNYTPGAADGGISPVHHTNIGMVIFALSLLIVCAGVAIWVYHIETPGIVFAPGASFTPVGGWLIVVAIMLFLTPLNVLRIFFNGDYFSLAAWNLYVHRAGSTAFHAIIIVETAGNIILFCLSIFCLVLLFNKRDITPKAMTCYFAFNVILALADLILSMSLNHGAVSTTAATAIVRSLVFAAIWIPYFQRATRVHETLIVPYPPYNFSYEKSEPKPEAE